jgi:hypothetical protein
MMITSNPGRIGLVKIHGAAGLGIRFGQYLNGSGFEDFEHAFMDLGDGTLIEAEPGGARIRSLSEYDGVTVHWCDNIYSALRPGQGQVIAGIARKFENVPYSFLDYDALAAHRFGLKTDFLREYIASSGHMICSQLVDRAYNEGGYHIFTDPSRWDGFVTPGDLYLADTVTAPWITTSFYARRDL